jgi:hypothetical protein
MSLFFHAILCMRSVRTAARAARAQHNSQFTRQGGAALYCLYLLREGVAKAQMGCFSFFLGADDRRRKAAV